MMESKHKHEMPVCHGCKMAISDDFLLQVAPDLKWHASCLQCSACGETLSAAPTCFMKNEKPYCKADYDRLFKVKCSGCNEALDKNTLVIKSENLIFHVNCFNCIACGKHLSPGDQFMMSFDCQLLCTGEDCIQDRNAYSDDASSDGNPTGYKSTEQGVFVDSESSQSPRNIHVSVKTEKPAAEGKAKAPSTTRKNPKEKPTRVRTVLNEKQLTTLKRCYAANPRPDSVMKEQLVDLTGLSSRVIRVWFQNKRCKDKKKSLMMMSANESTSRDMVQSQLVLHSSPLNEELSLPGCSTPLSSTSMTTQPNTIAEAVPSRHIMTNDCIYTNQASFPGYGLWTKYGNYHCAYQDANPANGLYGQLVA